MAERKLTKRIVDGLEEGAIAWDGQVGGFGVRRQRDARVYVLKVRIGGRQRWFTIGRHGSPWTVEAARTEALRLLVEIKKGGDPATIRAASRKQPTIKELTERYLEEHARPHKKPASTAADERNIRNHVLPVLEKLNVADVGHDDIERLKRSVREGKTARNEKAGPRRRIIVTGGAGAANRVLALVSKMFSLAELWRWRPEGSNPCKGVRKHAEGKRERFLSADELKALAKALTKAEAAESPYTIAAIRLLVLTGARLGEILGLRWDQVDLERGVARLPDSKTGAKTLFFAAPTAQLLAELPRREGNPHVIAGEKKGQALVGIQRPWRRIRKAAELGDVRLHDLRHSFASIAAVGGASLPLIGGLLGHTSPATTARYAHLSNSPLRALNEDIVRRIAAAMESEAPRENAAGSFDLRPAANGR
ncbi:MAG: tyrosine-type recombinase/integrase [Alphaproteobacteria bacterium]